MKETRAEKIQRIMKARQRDVVLVLEDIHDPHNSAAILRTADAFGIQTVHYIFNTVEPYDPARIGKASSSSANKWLTFFVYEKRNSKSQITNHKQAPNNKLQTTNNFEDRGQIPQQVRDDTEGKNDPVKRCLGGLKKEGYSIVGTAIHPTAIDLYKFKWPKKVALLVGNEHAGLSQIAISMCDAIVYIPMRGFVQSLNVSVATAICISELSRTKLLK